MTSIHYDPAGHTMEFRGHAGSAEAGHDLVCAAVSILMYTLVDAVMDRREELMPSIYMADAQATVTCCPPKKHNGTAEAIMQTVFAGCERLAAEFPQYVEAVKIEEV